MIFSETLRKDLFSLSQWLCGMYASSRANQNNRSWVGGRTDRGHTYAQSDFYRARAILPGSSQFYKQHQFSFIYITSASSVRERFMVQLGFLCGLVFLQYQYYVQQHFQPEKGPCQSQEVRDLFLTFLRQERKRTRCFITGLNNASKIQPKNLKGLNW